MSITVEKVITPKLAAEFLEKRASNQRNVKNNLVLKYAKDMLNGDFIQETAEIIFLDDGTLADGQHRLLALIKANKTFTFRVTCGVPASALVHMDRGRNRSVRDIFQSNGQKPNFAEMASFEVRVLEAMRSPSDSDLITMAEKQQDSYEFASRYGVGTFGKTMSAAYRVALSVFYRKNPTSAMSFAHKFANDDCPVQSGQWHLKRFLGTVSKHRVRDIKTYNACLLAMSLFEENKIGRNFCIPKDKRDDHKGIKDDEVKVVNKVNKKNASESISELLFREMSQDS